jgi:hypothetical protein
MSQKAKRNGLPQGATYAQKLAWERKQKEALQEAARDAMVKVEADIRVQRAMWLMCVAMNDAWSVGPDRFKRYAECLQDRTDWYEEMRRTVDDEYANEKLRLEAERCSGMKIEYLYDAEIREAKKRIEWDPGSNYDRIRMMSVQEMARFIREEVLGITGAGAEGADRAWEKWLQEKVEE